MRERLLMLAGRFSFVLTEPDWGPGRVDTFNSAKVIFNFPMDKLAPDERNAPADFPSIWLQGPRQGMQLHWDGNNTMVEERNKSAAFGTGTTPPTLDVAAIGRIEAWLLTREPPKYPYPIDAAKAARGGAVYKEYCADCHGASGRDFAGEKVGKVTPIAPRSAPTAAASIRTRTTSRSTRRRSTPDIRGASSISARPSATPTCRSTACGCARPTCTTARCRRCASCSSP